MKIDYKQIDEAWILSAIRHSIENYKSDVRICDGYMFNMPRTINKITLYTASKFETGDSDLLKNKKYFFNVVNPMCDNASKNIDVDTKDVNVRAEKVEYRVNSMVYNDYLKQWMKKENFGSFLNDVIDTLPKYGSIVAKKEKDGIKLLELRHLYIDPSVSSKKGYYNLNSSYIIEPHVMSIDDFQKMEWKWNKDAMDEINDVINSRLSQWPANVPEIRVMESYMRLPNSLFIKDAKGSDNYLVYCTMNDYEIANNKEYVWEDEDTSNVREVLWKERVLFYRKGFKPEYKKLDYKTVVGRQLGYGIVESSFDAQERFNELKNDIATKMRIGSNPIFFTKDKNVEENILTGTLPGDVIKANSEIVPINLDMKDLGNYNAEEGSWMNNVRMNSNGTEVSTGNNMPSGTPWRSVQQLSQSVAKFFDLKKEDIGLFLSEILTDWILPRFEKELKKEESIMILDTDTWNEILEQSINDKISKAVQKYIIKKAKRPTQEEIDQLREKLKNNYKGNPILDIDTKGFFDFKKKVYIDVTGETKNLQQRVESRINALQAIAQNPTILENPMIWKLFAATMEDTGIMFNEFGNNKQNAQIPSTADAGKTLAAAPGGAESINQMMNWLWQQNMQ